MFPPVLEKKVVEGLTHATRRRNRIEAPAPAQVGDPDHQTKVEGSPGEKKRKRAVAETKPLAQSRSSALVRIRNAPSTVTAEGTWSPEVKAVLAQIRKIQIDHSTAVNGPPAELSAIGFEPRTTLGGSSGMAYLTADERHVVKMYSTPGIANYEYWATRFFEANGIPVPKIALHTEAQVEGKTRYVIVKDYAEGFLLGELRHAEVKKLGILPYEEAGPSVEKFARKIRRLHGPAFGKFLAAHGVDPEIFGYPLKDQFIRHPGDVDDGRIWENVIFTARGWVLFDP